ERARRTADTRANAARPRASSRGRARRPRTARAAGRTSDTTSRNRSFLRPELLELDHRLAVVFALPVTDARLGTHDAEGPRVLVEPCLEHATPSMEPGHHGADGAAHHVSD